MTDKGSFNFALIKKHFRKLLLAPSFLCLDAPLVALGWAACLAASLSGVSPGLRRPEAIALFLSVWSIYLADRALDGRSLAKRAIAGAEVPPRHAWAKGRWRLLLALAALSATGALSTLPFLQAETVMAGLAVAVATELYFLLFRPARTTRPKSRLFPAKELAIAACFAFGVSVAASAGGIGSLPVLLLLALVALYLGNCLLISRAESGYDAAEDPAAYFAGGGGLRLLPEWVLLAAFGLGTISASFEGASPAALAVVLCAGLTFALARRRDDAWTRRTQPLADAILLIAWAFVVGG